MIIDVHIVAHETRPFADQFKTISQNKEHKYHLEFSFPLTENHLTELKKTFTNNELGNIKSISLSCDLTRINHSIFLDWLWQLKNEHCRITVILPPLEEQDRPVLQGALDKMAAFVAFPIYFYQGSVNNHEPLSIDLKGFQDQIFKNIQNKKNVAQNPKIIEQKSTVNLKDPLDKKMKLKDIILRQQQQKNDAPLHIPLQVQHVEMVQTEVMESVQEVVEVTQQIETETVQHYSGQLIGYQEFCQEPYYQLALESVGDRVLTDQLFQLVGEHLFANLPGEIKYLSPEAAMAYARQLSSLVIFNATNPPVGFVSKKSNVDEYILDVDPFFIHEQKNEFTPQPCHTDIDLTPIYPRQFPEEKVRQWIKNEEIFNLLCQSTGQYQSPDCLINLWIIDNDTGVAQFFSNLAEATAQRPELCAFLLKNYFSFFPQWAVLASEPSFFATLARISRYDSTKYNCLLSFLRHTGSSRYVLSQEVEAFEHFWREFTLLCAQYKVTTNCINEKTWRTPQGGQPRVYMEQLLDILRETRTEDQLQSLDFTLGNNTYYYAVRVEGFKFVCQAMNLVYDRETLNQRPFSLHGHTYRIELHDFANYWVNNQQYYQALNSDQCILVDCSQGLPNSDSSKLHQPHLLFKNLLQPSLLFKYDEKEFTFPYQLFEYSRTTRKWTLLLTTKPKLFHPHELSHLAFRVLGIQQEGISPLVFCNQFEQFKNQRGKCLFNKANVQSRYDDQCTQIFKQNEHQKYLLTSNELLYDAKGGNPHCALSSAVDPDNFKNLSLFFDKVPDGTWLSEEQLDFITKETRHVHRCDLSAELLIALLLTTHQGYSGESLLPLLKILKNLCDRSLWHEQRNHVIDNMVFKAVQSLVELYKNNVFLNDKEASLLFNYGNFSLSSKRAFMEVHLDHYLEAIPRLFKEFLKNKFAGLKLLKFLTKYNDSKHADLPIFVLLDIKELLENDPEVAIAYRDDLLLLSGIIHWEIGDAIYYKGHPDQKLKQAIENVGSYLKKSISSSTPNNLKYTFDLLLSWKEVFCRSHLLHALNEIEQLGQFAPYQVESILRKHEITPPKISVPVHFRNQEDIRQLLVDFIWLLKNEDNKSGLEQLQEPIAAMAFRLSCLYKNAKELQTIMLDLWSQKTHHTSQIVHLFFKLLKDIKLCTIRENFRCLSSDELMKLFAEKIIELPAYKDHDSFERVDFIDKETASLARLCFSIVNNPYVKNNKQYIELIVQADFSKFNAENLFKILSVFTRMMQRDYYPLMASIFSEPHFFADNSLVSEWISIVEYFHHLNFSTDYLATISRWIVSGQGKAALALIQEELTHLVSNDPKDPLLPWFMSQNVRFPQAQYFLHITKGMLNREKIGHFLTHLTQNNTLSTFIAELDQKADSIQRLVLAIISNGYAYDHKEALINYLDYARLLAQLNEQQLQQLFTLVSASPVSAACLFAALQKQNNFENISDFYSEFEKAPYEPRVFDKQFSCSEVERVVNGARDLINDSIFPLTYRHQMMEIFLLVNEMGLNLAFYDGKAAKDLSNADIRQHYQKLRQNNQIDLFRRRILAIPLVREALYRSTCQFLNSTQVLVLIDCILHKGNVVTNFATGQGKTPLDAAKVTLALLSVPRAHVTTVSLEDAKRDIERYRAFYELLAIPCSTKPITSNSSPEDYQTHGVNYSIFSELSLFELKLDINDLALRPKKNEIALIAGESDEAILHSYHVVYRLATNDGGGIPRGCEWVYYAINDFVYQTGFLESHATAREDISNLKNYLQAKAKHLSKSARFLDKYLEIEFHSWIKSALIAGHILQNEVHFLISEGYETKIINKLEVHTKAINILMSNHKTSENSTYGLCIQQFLYALLNRKADNYDFYIQEPSRTIAFSNNKNFVDEHLINEAIIWPSSASVGSPIEIAEQQAKYGFAFTEMPPHQISQVAPFEPRYFDDEAKQFDALRADLSQKTENAADIIFCKDIPTAKRLHALLNTHFEKERLQLYIGIGKKEKKIVQNAGCAGMITITTGALGRNTDIICDDKKRVLRVRNLAVDSVSGLKQKNGRTGRQGTPGEVHYYYNKMDLGGRTVDDIQRQLDETAQHHRNRIEEMHNLLGYFYRLIINLPEEHFAVTRGTFIKDTWATFCTYVESQFLDLWSEDSLNKQEVIEHCLEQFNEITKRLKTPIAPVRIEQLQQELTKKYPKIQPYEVDQQSVTMADCKPISILAYQLLNFVPEEKNPVQAVTQIKQQLKQFFNQLHKNNFDEKNKQHLSYLLSHPTSQAIVLQAHKEFARDLLQSSAKQPSLIKRWLGYHSALNKLATDEHCLLMFHTFSQAFEQPLCDITEVKKAVTTLFKDYLNHWLINSHRRRYAEAIIAQVNGARDIDGIINCLTNQQITLANNDVQHNLQSFFSLHRSGQSRLHETLNQSLKLVSALTGRTDCAQLLTGLSPILAKVTDGKPMPQLTLGVLKKKKQIKAKEPKTAAVLLSTVENVLKIKQREELSSRYSFFKQEYQQSTNEQISSSLCKRIVA